jgi:hypothetical protein
LSPLLQVARGRWPCTVSEARCALTPGVTTIIATRKVPEPTHHASLDNRRVECETVKCGARGRVSPGISDCAVGSAVGQWSLLAFLDTDVLGRFKKRLPFKANRYMGLLWSVFSMLVGNDHSIPRTDLSARRALFEGSRSARLLEDESG